MSEEVREKKYSVKKLKAAVLSLSLLTVMAGAAVAPALDLIRQAFPGTSSVLIQMIISTPALFIAITNTFFQKLCRRFKSRTLVEAGILMYVVGGCAAGLFDNIWLLLACRAVVGVGVGIIMPLSTGLIAFYFDKDQQDSLMGASSAMNMMGGVVATLIAGLLAGINWRASFLVYLLGLISIILCLFWMPNEYIYTEEEEKAEEEREAEEEAAQGIVDGKEKGTFARYYKYAIAIFLVMFTFFVYPANFAMEAGRRSLVPDSLVAVVMALGDIFGFFGGLAYPVLKRYLKRGVRFAAPVIFLAGYILLTGADGWVGALCGSFCVGFANGVGIPYIISTASAKAGKTAAATVMPLLSFFMYMAQFLAPFIISGVDAAGSHVLSDWSPFMTAVLSSVILILWSAGIREKDGE